MCRCAGSSHTVLMRANGEVIAAGDGDAGQSAVPNAPKGTRYIGIAAGARHTVLLRSDGEAVAFGDNSHGQCDVPELPDELEYVSVSAGAYHTVGRGESMLDVAGVGASKALHR